MKLVMVIGIVEVVMLNCVVAVGRPHPRVVTASDPLLGCPLGRIRPPLRAPGTLLVM